MNVNIDEKCPIYANCDEVRSMIEHFLIKSGINQTSWLKAIECNSNSLNRFRSFKGKGAGAEN